MLSVDFEIRLQSFAEGHGLGGDDVHQGAALIAWKHRGIDFSCQSLIIGQDQTATRPAQGLVRRRGNDMGVRQRIRIETGRDKPGVMRHIDHQICANFVGDPAERCEINGPRIGRCAGDDQLWFGL